MIDNISFNKIVVSNKVSFDKNRFKYFIGYKDTENIESLLTFPPKMSAHRRDFDKTKCLSFLIKDEKLSVKCNKNWEKVKKSFKKEYDSKPVYNKIKKLK